MTKRQTRKQIEFINGYKKGYHGKHALKCAELYSKSADFRRGYYAARKDLNEGETALY